jgi:hypothetical protein
MGREIGCLVRGTKGGGDEACSGVISSVGNVGATCSNLSCSWDFGRDGADDG